MHISAGLGENQDLHVNSTVFADPEPQSWDEMEAIWEYLYDQLGADFTQHPVIVTQPAMPALSLSQKMSEIFFEKFQVPKFYLATAPLLSAYAYGSNSGLVVDIGDSSAQVLPLIDGYMLDAHVRRVMHLGGKKDTQRIINFLLSNNSRPDKYATDCHVHAMARHLKDTLAYCSTTAAGYDDEIGVMGTVQDFLGEEDTKGNVNMVGLQKELLNCGEVLFNPRTVLNDYDDSILSIPELIADCVKKCDLDTRSTLLGNIFLSGGVSTMPGFKQRLEAELKLKIPHARNIRVSGNEARYAVWTGGSVLSQLDTFQNSYCRQSTYKEVGMYVEGGDEDLLKDDFFNS